MKTFRDWMRRWYSRVSRVASPRAGGLYRRLVEQSLTGAFVLRQDRFLYVNPRFAELYGGTIGEMLRVRPQDLVFPEDREKITELIRSRLRGEAQSAPMILSGRRLDGRRIMVEAYGVRTVAGGQPAIMGTLVDITAWHDAEAALREAKDYAENLIHTASVMIVGLDITGRIEVFNETAQRITGYTLTEVQGANWFERLVPRDRFPEVWTIFSRLPNGRLPPAFQNPILTKSGEERLITWNNNAVYRQGAIVGSISFGIDLTENLRTQEALRRSEAKYRTLVEQSVDAIFLISPEGRLEEANPAGCLIPGFAREELIGRHVSELVAPEEVGRVPATMAALLAGEKVCSEWICTRKDKGTFVAELRARLLPDGGIQAVLSDITERKQVERERAQMAARLVHAQEDVQRRIAREIHDTVTQNLVALQMQLEALRKTTASHPSPAALDQTITLASQSTEQLRTLSYLLHPPLLEDLGLTGALHDFALGFAERSGVRVECDFAHDLPPLASEVQLALYRVAQESLHNIHRHAHSPTAAIRLWAEENEIWLEIADAGCGIPPARLRALEQFSSGLGVGIPGMRERVRLLGGRLQIHSSLRGTTVQSIVPFTPPSAPDTRPAPPA
ncbi:MAG: PAS domain S-box protein [Verrucomicrobia bacterium]|nr:PAS domain S-box protein [Verrucomicrobiota bacterium]